MHGPRIQKLLTRKHLKRMIMTTNYNAVLFKCRQYILENCSAAETRFY